MLKIRMTSTLVGTSGNVEIIQYDSIDYVITITCRLSPRLTCLSLHSKVIAKCLPVKC